ncbi:MAG: ubiquinone/menaquinone biosynthesis methyltransferase [Chloroflexota bacterium]
MKRRPGYEFNGPGDSRQLFSRIAQEYDGLNRLMSLGRDRHWRRLAADAARLPPGGCVLDVGTGTGDLALALTERHADAEVVGVDPTAAMMAVGRRKAGTERVRWAQADGLRLPFPDRRFDAAVSAFLLRNVVDVPRALAEQHRVVREGGRVVCLEMSWPRAPLFGALFRLYFADLMPRIAGALSGQPAAYRYLPRSVQHFLTPQELTRAMETVGLQNPHCRTLALGTVTLHVGERAGPKREDRNG